MQYICECGNKFENIQSYRSHRYRCLIGKDYYKKEQLEINNLNNELYSQNEDKYYICDCGIKCKTKSRFIYHIKRCDKSKNILNKYNQLQILIRNRESNEIYKCNTCGKEFNTLVGLSLHCTNTQHNNPYKKNNQKIHKHLELKKCHICKKEFKTYKDLLNHYKEYHDITFINKYDFIIKYKNYLKYNEDIPKCKYCGKNDIDCRSNRLTNYCHDCKHLYLSDIQKQIHKNNPQLAENARQRRLKYLSDKSNFNSTAFGKRANKELSFLEKWFYDNIIQKYNLTDKYTIINEYTESIYFLDFAFINIKLDVELDGKCHFNNDNKRIEHDIERDNFLINKGWNIYRISWNDVKFNEQETINKFIKLLNDNKFKYDKSYYIRHKVISNKEFKYQEKQRNNKKEQQLLKKQQQYDYYKNIIIDLEKNSGINFSKFGWVKLANEYLNSKNIIIKQLHRTIKKYYPNFFINNNVFIRNN